MNNIIKDFRSFVAINESLEDGTNIIIGDSCTPIILKRSKTLDMIGNVGSERSLWKSGTGSKWLKEAVSKYQVTPNVKNVVINIGTNDGYNPRMDIKGLVAEVRRVFPSAKLFVVQGSWGWGNNKNITPDKVKAYYDKFRAENVVVIEPPIGSVKDPHKDLPVYTQIGAAIDVAIRGDQRVSPEVATNTGNNTVATAVAAAPIVSAIISRPGDPYKYKVENDHWLAKRDNQSKWYEITGVDFKPAYQTSIDILDKENPNVRSKTAPKKGDNPASNMTIKNDTADIKLDPLLLSKFPIKLSGSYRVPNIIISKGDALHSFDKRKIDGFGGYMLTGRPIPNRWTSYVKLDQGKGINQVLSELISSGIKPDVTDIKIKVNSDNSVNWEATIDQSKDGQAYAGVASRGSTGANADKRALEQIPSMKLKRPNAYNWKEVLDLNITQPVKIRQYFLKYSER
jgi:hypothetical protein